MNRRKMFKLAVVMLSGVCAMNAFANGFRLADQDAFATARGEAFVATADNPSAVYYNPAGITHSRAAISGAVFMEFISTRVTVHPAVLRTAAILTTVRITSPPFPNFFTPALPRIHG